MPLRPRCAQAARPAPGPAGPADSSSRRTAGSSRSISTKARSSGRWPTATVRAITRRSKRLNLPPLGQGGRVAPLVTKTLCFSARGPTTASSPRRRDGGGKMFRAYDKASGAVVWETELPGGTSGAPMTYMFNGQAVHRGRDRVERHARRMDCADAAGLSDKITSRGNAEIAEAAETPFESGSGRSAASAFPRATG